MLKSIDGGAFSPTRLWKRICDPSIDNRWFSGTAGICTYSLSELLATKLRALYQRKKGRDLFDIWLGLNHPDFSAADMVEAAGIYMAFSGATVSRAQFEANLEAKLKDATFVGDLRPLLRAGIDYECRAAWRAIHEQVISRLPGRPWRGCAET